MSFTDKVCAQLRELPFLKSREASEQFFPGYQGQHRVAKELELFVIAGPQTVFRRLLRLEFPRLRAVGECLIQKFRALEVISQKSFQRRDFFRFHADSGHKELMQNVPRPISES